MKKHFFITIVLLIFITSFSSCQKEKVCNVNNPKKDLPWLQEIIDQYKEKQMYRSGVKIYQCSYRDGTGFLFESNSKHPPFGSTFRNCEGIIVCGITSGGVSGYLNTCSDFNIDFENKKLIYCHK